MSEELVAQSSEDGTVSIIPDDSKQNGENHEIHFNETRDKANNEVTRKEKTEATTSDIDKQ